MAAGPELLAYKMVGDGGDVTGSIDINGSLKGLLGEEMHHAADHRGMQ